MRIINKSIAFLNKVFPNTIKARLIAWFVLMSSFPLLITGIVQYSMSSSALEEKIRTFSHEVLNQLVINIDTAISNVEAEVIKICGTREVSDNLAAYSKDKNDFTAKMFLEKTIKQSSLPKYTTLNANFVTDKLEMINKLGVSEFDKEEMTYLTEQIKEEDLTVNWGVINVDGQKQLAMIRPVKSIKSNEIAGYMVVTFKSEFLLEFYQNIDIGKNSDLLIINSNGIILSSRNNNFTLGDKLKNKSVFNNISSNVNGKMIDFNKMKKLLTYSPLKDWYIIALIEESNIVGTSRTTGLYTLLLALVCLTFAIIISVLISKGISKPLSYLMENMNKVKEGILDVDFSVKARYLEINSLLTNFKFTVESLKNLIKEAYNSSDVVHKRSDEVNETASNILSLLKQVNMAVEQIALGADSQSYDVANCVTQMNTLSDNISRVVTRLAEISESAGKTSVKCSSSIEVVRMLDSTSAKTKDVIDSVSKNIIDLSSQFKMIEKFSKIIVDIANQIKLISLNASIEAARFNSKQAAGFNIIANETRKLAEKSKHQATYISKMINDIQKQVDLSTNELVVLNEVVKEQLRHVFDTNNSFNDINSSMAETMENVKSIDSVVREMLESKDTAVKSLMNISSVIEEFAASTEEVLSSVEQGVYVSNDLFEHTSQMNGVVQKLKEDVSVFKVN